MRREVLVDARELMTDGDSGAVLIPQLHCMHRTNADRGVIISSRTLSLRVGTALGVRSDDVQYAQEVQLSTSQRNDCAPRVRYFADLAWHVTRKPHVNVSMQLVAERIHGAAVDAAGAQAPPWILPGEHFTAALAFFAVGATGLIAIAPELAVGAFFVPHVIAVVHLFTLGWIMLSIFGALCQFLPVAIGRGLRWPTLAHVTFSLQVLGAAAFVVGLATGRPTSIVIGASALSAAFVLFAFHLGVTLGSVRERSVMWCALAGASVFLVVTPLYGLALQLNLIGGLGVHRFHVVAVHAHVAIVGVVLLVIVGVAHRLIPMFLLSHGATERPAWLAVALLFAGAVLLALPVGGLELDAVGGVLAAAGVIAFVVQAIVFFRHRKRRALDPGMRLAAAGLIGLLAAVTIAPFAFSRGLADIRLLTTYFVVLLGAISLFVAGHYYKIVPFLVWYHRFGPLVGTRKVPKVSELFSERAALAGALSLVAGYAALALGTYLRSTAVVRAGAVSFVIGALVEAIVIAGIARRRPA